MHSLSERTTLAPVVVMTAISGPSQALNETAVRDVECGMLFISGCLGTDHRTLAMAGDLDANGLVGQPGIRLLRNFDVDAVALAVIPLDLRQLLRNVLAESI
jgi:hypothetical protein